MAEEILARRLPFSLEAEQSVLGSILIDPDKFNDISQQLTYEDFYLPEHQEIFSAMQSLVLHDARIDHVILIDELVKAGVYNIEQAKSYIMTIADIVPSAENIRDYAKIVKDKSLLRRLIGVCAKIEEDAYGEIDEADFILGSAESRIFELTGKKQISDFTHVRDVIIKTYEQIREISTNPEAASGTPTGFSDIDNTLVGLGSSDLVLIGARPGMGKTSFALNIATNVAHRTGKAVCIFSLEMSKEQLVARMLSSEALIDSKVLRTGMLSSDDWNKLATASTYLSECDIYIDDTSGISVSGMKSKLLRMQKKNLGLVIVDYLQLMQSDERRRDGNRVQEVADISRNLKIMAKQLNVPVICCAQLSRSPESRTDKRPMLSDLRDSGAIEQDADIVMFLYRDEYYKDDPTKQNTAEVIVAKNRHGNTGRIEMNWFGQYTKFSTKDNHDV